MSEVSHERILNNIHNAVMDSVPQIDKEEILGAIRDGVRDAMWQMITNATGMPCHDFFDTINNAAHKAFCEAQKDK